MPIAEGQLDTWSHRGSVTQSASTYQTLRAVLLDPAAPYAARDFEVFLQGSYGNDTNIYADSDVDIVVCLNSTYYEDIAALTPEDRVRHDADWSPATYGLAEFKAEVAAWLARNFGNEVDASGKAVFVPGGSGRRDADVLACAQFRRYRSYSNAYSLEYEKGICFWSLSGALIDNFPKQHSANLTAKHQRTGQWTKPIVRIFKNWRNALVRDGFIADAAAPSYFLEGMLSNVPDQLYGRSYQDTCANALEWLQTTDRSQLTCANSLHWLVRDGHSVCWSTQGYQSFLYAAERDWAST